MKRLIILLSVILPLLSSCAGKGIKDIKVNSFELLSLTPKGLRDIDALVKVDVHNPSVSFELTDLSGLLKLKGKDVLTLSADQLIVAGKTDKTYTIPVHGTMAEDFNPFRLLEIFNAEGGDSKLKLDDVTLDLNLRPALRGGLGKKIEIKDITLSKLLEKK